MSAIQPSASRLFPKIVLFLYLVNILERFYGIWFPRWAWDEAEYYFGAVNITTFLSGLLQGECRVEEFYDFMGPNGTLNKYICVIPVSLGIFTERLFDIHYPVPIGLIFCRITLALIPNVLILVYVQKIIKLIWNNPFLLILNLLLFLLPFRLVETSVYAVSDSLVTFLCVASVYYLIRYRMEENNTRKAYFLKINILFCLLAVSTKCPPGCATAGTTFLILLYDLYRKNIQWKFLSALFPFMLKIIIPLFILINLPYLLLYNLWLEDVFGYLYIIKGHPLTYFLMTPSLGIGVPLAVLSCAGLLYSFVCYRKTLLPVFIFILIYYVFLSTTYGATHNWHIPLIPFLVLFSTVLLHSLYLFLKEKSNVILSTTMLCAGLLFISFIPLKNIVLFKLNIPEQPGTQQQVLDYFSGIPKDKYIFIRDEKIKSVTDLEKSNVEYLVLTDDWFSLKSHPYPDFLLRHENFQKQTYNTDWLSIRKHVEENWKSVQEIHPLHPSPWTNNTSVNADYFIYQKQTSFP